MSRDLDTRARQASSELKRAIDATEFTSVAPSPPTRRPAMALRPVLIMALLLIGASVAVGLVQAVFSERSEETPPTITTVESQSSASTVSEESPPTTAYVAPATPTTKQDTTPPMIVVTSPEDGAELKTERVRFEGETEPGATVHVGPYEAEVDVEGTWSIVLILNEGSNVARFTARDAAGNEAEAAITVSYVAEKPSTTTTTEAKELGEFTAFSQFGSCAEDPPYDVYYGTGHPGSTVKIVSDYGTAIVEVGESGNWEKKVIFESAPANKPFLVTVKDEFGRSAKFEFVYQPA